MPDTFSDLMRQFQSTHFTMQPPGTLTLRQLMAERGLTEAQARRFVREHMERVGDIGTDGRAGAHEVVYRYAGGVEE